MTSMHTDEKGVLIRRKRPRADHDHPFLIQPPHKRATHEERVARPISLTLLSVLSGYSNNLFPLIQSFLVNDYIAAAKMRQAHIHKLNPYNQLYQTWPNKRLCLKIDLVTSLITIYVKNYTIIYKQDQIPRETPVRPDLGPFMHDEAVFTIPLYKPGSDNKEINIPDALKKAAHFIILDFHSPPPLGTEHDDSKDEKHQDKVDIKDAVPFTTKLLDECPNCNYLFLDNPPIGDLWRSANLLRKDQFLQLQLGNLNNISHWMTLQGETLWALKHPPVLHILSGTIYFSNLPWWVHPLYH